MALSKSSLKDRIVQEMEAMGAKASGEHSWVDKFAEALASAVVDEIQQNAQVPVSGGSSAGSYPVQ
ncbi:hypothetical protein [Vibrio injensis]|uniref:hypothetical protein n=1 Tax=Vibrio injensis TaxID=1307414 RepID=UPI000933799A|nr:hypothetical protein [Vibrio injensis]